MDDLRLAWAGANSLLILINTIMLLVHIWRSTASAEAPVTRRQLERLHGRMDRFEGEQSALITRMDTLSRRESERETAAANWRVDMTQSAEAQLDASRRNVESLEKVLAELRWMRDTLHARPCIYNEENNGGKSCPDGQPIEGNGKMDVYDPKKR